MKDKMLLKLEKDKLQVKNDSLNKLLKDLEKKVEDTNNKNLNEMDIEPQEQVSQL